MEPPLNGVGLKLLVSLFLVRVFEFAICLWMMGRFPGRCWDGFAVSFYNVVFFVFLVFLLLVFPLNGSQM